MNFSIVVPGNCNAACSFCDSHYMRRAPDNYLELLRKAVEYATMELGMRECSITGGEPTISPMLPEILEIARENFEKVVLTTNGTRLASNMGLICENVDHVNLSRHAVGFRANTQVFRTTAIPDDSATPGMITELNKAGIDVTLNCVYEDDMKDSVEFLRYANTLGANRVCFRNDHRLGMDETTLERRWADWTVIETGGCPTCRSSTILAFGKEVTFKASVEEPSRTIGSIYELIFQPEGKLTTDWAGDLEYSLVDASDWAGDLEYSLVDASDWNYTPSALFHESVAAVTRSGGCGRVEYNSRGC